MFTIASLMARAMERSAGREAPHTLQAASTRATTSQALLSTTTHSVAEEDTSSKAPAQKQSQRRIKVYTKKGDKGTSSLFTGERRKKTDGVFDALGAIDELSSDIGIAISLITETVESHPSVGYMKPQLIDVQCMLQDVASYVATPKSSASQGHLARVDLPEEYVTQLETWIDSITEGLSPLTNFILPGGGALSARIHKSRTLARKAERAIVGALEEEGDIDCVAVKYINRLSDYLFTLARSAAKEMGDDEIIYTRRTANVTSKTKQ